MITALQLYSLIKKNYNIQDIIYIQFTELQDEYLRKEFSSKYRDIPVEANEYLQHNRFFKMPVEITPETGKEDFITLNIKDKGLHELQIKSMDKKFNFKKREALK